MDNDIPENQQDRKIAVSAIKHLDQSKKRKNILIAVVSLFKENWLYEKFSLFYLEEIKCLEPEDTLQLTLEADSEEQREFYQMVGDFLLQKRQKQVIARNLF